MDNFKVGDFITCKDADDMIHTMTELHKAGVQTDFNYDIPDTYRLKVLSVREELTHEEIIREVLGRC